MVSVYFIVSLMAITFITPTLMFSHDIKNKKEIIEEKHINELAQPHHDLKSTLNNVKFKKYFSDYMQSFIPLRGYRNNLIFWAASTAFENFLRYEIDNSKASEKIWDKAKSFLKQIKDKINSSYIDKLYAAIQNKSTTDLMNSVASIREYFYKSLEVPFKLFHSYFKKLNKKNN